LSVMRGEEPKLTDEAHAIAEQIHIANATETEIVESVRSAVSGSSTGDIDIDSFVELLRTKCGVTDETLVQSLFAAADRDGSGSISASELSSLLFAFHKSNTTPAPERFGYLFDCCDLDGGGELEFDELRTMIRGLLSMREALLQFGGDVNSFDAADALASASGSYRRREYEELRKATPEKRAVLREKMQRIRLQDLRSKYAKFRDRPETTLDDILRFESGRIAQRIFAEADTIDSDNKLSRDEFVAWIQRDSTTAKKFLHLFEAFEPLINEG